jgi:hypothetical protein
VLPPCEECGRHVEVVGVGASAPILCDLCAWTLQQEHAKAKHVGRSPPPEAYREVRLEENWSKRVA